MEATSYAYEDLYSFLNPKRDKVQEKCAAPRSKHDMLGISLMSWRKFYYLAGVKFYLSAFGMLIAYSFMRFKIY